MHNASAKELEKILSDSEAELIYGVLAREDLDIASRYKFLKPYTLDDAGMGILKSVVIYAIGKERAATRSVDRDEFDNSDIEDYEEKVKIPQRVIADLLANIRMGLLVKAHPFWYKKDAAQAAQPETSAVMRSSQKKSIFSPS